LCVPLWLVAHAHRIVIRPTTSNYSSYSCRAATLACHPTQQGFQKNPTGQGQVKPPVCLVHVSTIEIEMRLK
jgi:hypothetical protein